MSLKNTHQAGETIFAVDINSNVTAIIQNQNNIFELFLQNYFDGKFPSASGLFFDGFSDELKKDILTNLFIDTGAQVVKFALAAFGSGSDGDLTTGATVKVDDINEGIAVDASSGQADIEVDDGSVFSAGKKVFIHQSQGVGVGDYEFAEILSIATNVLTLKVNLSNSYATIGGQVLQLMEWNNVTVESGGVLNCDAWDGTRGGLTIFLASGKVTVESGGDITASKLGFRGGASNNFGPATAFQGEGETANGVSSGSSNGAGAGGGRDVGSGASSSGGSGGHANAGTVGTSNSDSIPGAAGGSIGVATLATLFFGGGGGGGTDSASNTTSGRGGNGGGIVVIIANEIEVITTGTITSDGENGFGGGGAGQRGVGGGGAGGSVLLLSDVLTLGTSLVTTSAGLGGVGNVMTGPDASVGRIAINTDTTTSTGTTSPSAGSDGTVLGIFPEFTSGVYESIVTPFQVAKDTARCWVTRSLNSKYNIDTAIVSTDTTLTILGDVTSEFKSGDTIDISNDINTVRERVSLTIDSTFGGGVTTLTFTPAITNGFGTSDFVERVDVIPRLSLVDSGDAESFQTLTYVQSIVDFTNGVVEDEYSLSTTAQEDLKVELTLTRNDTSIDVEASLLGVAVAS